MGVLGVLTAGGDCPGLNAVIRGVVGRADERGEEVLGILNGWEGLMKDNTTPLDRDKVRGILGRGGTILGTSRMDPYFHGDGLSSCDGTLSRNGIDRIIVIGGDGTLRSAMRLADEGMNVIGVPKTIDNDICGTDITLGSKPRFRSQPMLSTDLPRLPRRTTVSSLLKSWDEARVGSQRMPAWQEAPTTFSSPNTHMTSIKLSKCCEKGTVQVTSTPSSWLQKEWRRLPAMSLPR